MTQVSETRKPRRNQFVGCLVLLVLALVLLGIVGAFFVSRSQPTNVTALQVFLSAPQSGDMVEVNRPIPIDASAAYSAGVARLELYADGALIAAEQSVQNESRTLNLVRDWTPRATGRHVLVARGYGRDNKFVDSNVAYLDVLELLQKTQQTRVGDIPRSPNAAAPSLRQIGAATNIPLRDLQNTNPSLGTNPDAPLALDTPIDLPRSPAPPSGSSDVSTPGGGPSAPPSPLPGAPSAPTNLHVVADCSVAELTWTESPDAEQYTIYRLGSTEVTLNHIASLPQHSITFRDTLPGLGDYRYQVAAVRGGLEALSGMQLVSTPDACAPPPPPDRTDLVLTLISLQTETRYDGVHCYLSVDGGPYERVPSNDFVDLSPTDARGLLYDFLREPRDSVPNRGEVPLPRHSNSTPVTLSGECMGKLGATSTRLGTLSISIARDQWDGSIREATLQPILTQVAKLETPSRPSAIQADAAHFRLRYSIGPNTAVHLGDLLARAFGGRISPSVVLQPPHLDPGGFRTLGGGGGVPPPFNVRYDPNGRDACMFAGDGSARAILACVLFGLPTLTWDWNGNPNWNDRDLVWTYGEEHATDPHTGSNIVVRALDSFFSMGPSARAALVPRPRAAPCNTDIAYQMSVRVTDHLGNYFDSLPSAPVVTGRSVPCDVVVTVGFDRLILGAIHNTSPCIGDCDRSHLSTSVWLFACPGASGYDATQLTLLGSNDTNNDVLDMRQGAFQLASQFMRTDRVAFSGSNDCGANDAYRLTGGSPLFGGSAHSYQMIGWGYHNNEVQVGFGIFDVSLYPLTDNSLPLKIFAEVKDRGFHEDFCPGCGLPHRPYEACYIPAITIGPYTRDQWATINQSFVLEDTNINP